MTDLGGDPACWADRVCEACGQLVEDDRDHVCPRADSAADDSDDVS